VVRTLDIELQTLRHPERRRSSADGGTLRGAPRNCSRSSRCCTPDPSARRWVRGRSGWRLMVEGRFNLCAGVRGTHPSKTAKHGAPLYGGRPGPPGVDDAQGTKPR